MTNYPRRRRHPAAHTFRCVSVSLLLLLLLYHIISFSYFSSYSRDTISNARAPDATIIISYNYYVCFCCCCCCLSNFCIYIISSYLLFTASRTLTTGNITPPDEYPRPMINSPRTAATDVYDNENNAIIDFDILWHNDSRFLPSL